MNFTKMAVLAKASVWLVINMLAINVGMAQTLGSNGAIVPVLSLLLDEAQVEPALTDNSDVQCSFDLSSISPSVGSDIPIGSSFGVTINYQLS